MPPLEVRFPDLQSLTRALSTILSAPDPVAVTVLDRVPTPVPSTFPSEIVTCRVGDRQLRIHCKYESGQLKERYGHRGGPAYEADVYRHVLVSSAAFTPPFYGSVADQRTGHSWLFIGYVSDGTRLGRQLLTEAARWAGRFHAENESRASTVMSLKRYDVDYYAGWARRTSEFAGELHCAYPWLADLCTRFETSIAPTLASSRLTVSHGEYYPGNILDVKGAVCPVDWESAAVAAGEIDLAMLTDDWPAESTRACEAAYAEARWSSKPPDDYLRVLACARMYVHFRWLGDKPRWTQRRGFRSRFDDLGTLGRMLGLITSLNVG